jgi:glucokinase
MSVLAVDLGGSHIGCALTEGGRILAKRSMRVEGLGLKPLLPAVKQSLLQCCRESQVDVGSCDGVGVAFPALVDSQTNELLSMFYKFADIRGPELEEWSESELGLPLRIENDARLALLGEHGWGSAQGFDDVVMVTLGTGIGVAAMLQRRLLRSRLGQAGQLGGHITVKFDGDKCACGAIGCAESEASTSTLTLLCHGWPGFARSSLATQPNLDFAALWRCCDEGDHTANAILGRCIQVWSALTVSLIHAYGPEIVVLGGGIMKRSEDILPRIREYVDKHSWKTSRGVARIEAASLGDAAALVGAEALFERPEK